MDNIRVLLVDDEERFVQTTQRLLARKAIDVLTALNGREALARLNERNVDVVILDIKMPGMDGIEVLRHIKRDHPLVEVIMLTGHASVESAVDGLKLGAFDYVMKPCDIAPLLAKIQDAYERKRAQEEKIQQARIERIIKTSRGGV